MNKIRGLEKLRGMRDSLPVGEVKQQTAEVKSEFVKSPGEEALIAELVALWQVCFRNRETLPLSVRQQLHRLNLTVQRM